METFAQAEMPTIPSNIEDIQESVGQLDAFIGQDEIDIDFNSLDDQIVAINSEIQENISLTMDDVFDMTEEEDILSIPAIDKIDEGDIKQGDNTHHGKEQGDHEHGHEHSHHGKDHGHGHHGEEHGNGHHGKDHGHHGEEKEWVLGDFKVPSEEQHSTGDEQLYSNDDKSVNVEINTEIHIDQH